MRKVWKTKYGLRRVRYDPPTLEQAIFAAKGMADDLQNQVEIAASLMGLPVEQVRPEVLKSERGSTRASRVTSIDTASHRSVIVEHRPRRRSIHDGMPPRIGASPR